MIKGVANQPVMIPTLTFKPPPPSAPSSLTCGSSFQIPHYSQKKPFHKDCFSFAGVIYAGLNINTNLTSGTDEMKNSEMIKQRTNVENREFFEQFLFKKNRRGLLNCLTEMEKVKYKLTFENHQIISIIRIYEKIIRKYMVSVVDVKHSDNIDTVLSSSAHSLLGIPREMQRKICEKFENFIRMKDWMGLWNAIFTSVKLEPIVEEQVVSIPEVSNNEKISHEKTSSISHFFRRFSTRPNKNSSPSASAKDEQSFLNQLKVEEGSVKRKRGNSMTFRFKSLKEDEVNQLHENFRVNSENGKYGLTLEDFEKIFDILQDELIKQLKILFDQYVEDSDEYEMFLIERVQKRNMNDFPEVFNKPIVTKSTGALLNVNTNQSKTPSPNTSSLTREHSFPPTITTSSEEISTCESMSPVSPSNDHSPIHVTPQFDRPKLSIPIPNSNQRNSSEFDHDSWSEPLASPRKLKTLFSVEEKKKKKKEKEKTERKVQTIQEQMNKYNKIISSLYKDLIERDGEIQQLKHQLAQFEDLSSMDDEQTDTEELQSFDEINF